MELNEILSKVDHTLLSPTATWEEIRRLCDEGLKFGVASVCLPPSYVGQAARYLSGRLPVCTVIGFPNGYCASEVKRFEARLALDSGAAEIDMVINLGWVKDRLFDNVLGEIKAVKAECGQRVLKVIVETCLLTDDEKIRLCSLVSEAGADYIKTSTGFSTGGATKADVALLAAHAPSGLKVKASGGIATLDDAEEFIRLGASRLGTSKIVKIAAGLQGGNY